MAHLDDCPCGPCNGGTPVTQSVTVGGTASPTVDTFVIPAGVATAAGVDGNGQPYPVGASLFTAPGGVTIATCCDQDDDEVATPVGDGTWIDNEGDPIAPTTPGVDVHGDPLVPGNYYLIDANGEFCPKGGPVTDCDGSPLADPRIPNVNNVCERVIWGQGTTPAPPNGEPIEIPGPVIRYTNETKCPQGLMMGAGIYHCQINNDMSTPGLVDVGVNAPFSINGTFVGNVAVVGDFHTSNGSDSGSADLVSAVDVSGTWRLRCWNNLLPGRYLEIAPVGIISTRGGNPESAATQILSPTFNAMLWGTAASA